MNLIEHMVRQQNFSVRAFGPGPRMEGVTDHIKKELVEVADGGNDPKEWVDVVLLGLDGLWRSLRCQFPHLTETEIACLICEMIEAKQTKNEARNWPDWRTAPLGKAIQHVRGDEDDGA